MWLALRCVAICSLAIAGILGAAQSSAPLREEVVSTWTTDQGLPQNFVSALAQTPDGHLWVGTLTGLARFDGVSFRGFGKDGPAEMQDNICGLFPDDSNGLWICAADRLFHYQNKRFLPILMADSRHYRIETIGKGRNGNVWIYAAQELAHTQGGRLEIVPYPQNTGPARSLVETSDGVLWIADGEGITAMHGNSGATHRYPLPEVQLLYVDPDGRLYAGNGHKLFQFDGHSFLEMPNPGLNNFVSLMVDRERRLWMASGGLHGLSRETGNTVEQFTEADGLASNDVRAVMEDASGDIWVGTISGLQRLHRGLFTTMTLPPLPDGKLPQIDSVFEQKNGAIWAGTVEDGVFRWLNNRWQQFSAAEGLPKGQIRGFFENGAMPAVAISDYGIFAWNRERFTKLPGIPHAYIGTPAIAGDGSVWFNLLHHGVARMHDGQVQVIGSQQGLLGDRIWSVVTDPSGATWAGTSSALERWDGARFRIIYASQSPVLSMEWIHGGMAIGTMHGLILRSDSGAARILTQDDGLPGNTVLCVIKDAGSNLWIATTRAIARLPRQQWMDILSGRAARITPAIYTQTDGLKNGNVLPLNIVTAMRASDGHVWFATAGGISSIDPRLPADLPAQATMDAVFVDEQPLPAVDTTVPPGRHRITFRYTAPGGVAAAQTQFRYRLAGWDKQWIDAGRVREVSYTALPPGSYTFEVMAANREGNGSLQPAAIQLNLKPYFWQTTWFVVLTILCAAAILVEVTRRRTHRMAARLNMRFEERVAERERIAYQIHDTLIQDLIGATLKLELLSFQVADHPEQAGNSIDGLTGKMRETIARSRNMVSNLHSTAVSQYDLVEMLRYAEAEFRLNERPTFTLESTGVPRPVHPLVRDEVHRICREALANAFRHADAQDVRVSVRFFPSQLEVEIADNGQGMSEETRLHGRPGHFGLRGMQAHAARIGATVEIASSSMGTTVTLRVRTRRLEMWQRWWRKGIRKELKD